MWCRFRRHHCLLGGVSALVIWGAGISMNLPNFNTTTALGASRQASPASSWTIPPRPDVELCSRLEKIMGQNDSQVYLGDSCRPTSQIRIIRPTSQDQKEGRESAHWLLQTMDDRGQLKTQGGDEFYVAYFDDYEISEVDPTAVAWVLDHHDGTYELDFVSTPLRRALRPGRRGKGILHVFFQYTCSIGTLFPPTKEAWKSGGLSNLYFTQTNVPEPPIRLFEPPSKYNLSQFATVFFVGDSLFHQLARTEEPERNYFRPNTYMADVIQSDLNMATLVPKFLNHLVTRHGREFEGFVPGLKQQRDTKNIAVLIGSSVWDLLASTQQDPSWLNHLAACRSYVEEIQKRFPRITVIWKSGTAMHVHRLPADCAERNFCKKRTRYMSSSRAELLYRRQKQLMETLNVPFLDLYEASYLSAYRSRHDDGRHYTDEWNNQISTFLFGIDE